MDFARWNGGFAYGSVKPIIHRELGHSASGGLSKRVRHFIHRRFPRDSFVSGGNGSGNGNGSAPTGPNFEAERRAMVARQIRHRGIRSPRVIDAMETVPRHLFVPPEHTPAAYADSPLPIGEGQTISQPYMVAAMAEALSLEGPERLLEVGAGSGYQAAVLSRLAREVIAVETQPALADAARERLARLGFANVRVEQGDGSLGWPADAPYDAILVAAGAPAIPQPLVDQLAEGGRLVIPVGPADHQELVRITKKEGKIFREALFACRFVPLIGSHGWPPASAESTEI
jgi:protein-L-isoaspartate(D-aspartate) O-methyltransferase